jgi:hypothetical protein
MQIKSLINIEKESARGRNQRKYLSTTQRKKQSPIIENQTQLVRGLEKLTKKEQHTKRVGRRQINNSL